MSAEDALTTVARMLDLYNDGTPESYGSDRFVELFDPAADIEMLPSAQFPAGRRMSVDELREELTAVSARMVDRHVDVHETLADGERVVVRYTFSGTTTVDAPGTPAGSRISMDGSDFYTVADGRITRYLQSVGMPRVAPQSGN